MRGRKPQPTKLKLVKGNPGRRKLNGREPTPPPADLSKAPANLTAVAKAEWRRVIGEVGSIGMITGVDKSALTAYCSAWSDYREAEEILKREGVVTTNASGSPIKHPAVEVKNAAFTQMLKWCSELGLTPSSRTRLKVPEKKKSTEGPKLVNLGS